MSGNEPAAEIQGNAFDGADDYYTDWVPKEKWGEKLSEVHKNAVLGYDSMPHAYMEAQQAKVDEQGSLSMVSGLCFVFAVQYLIDFEADVFSTVNGTRDYAEKGLKTYLFFMSMSTGISGLGMCLSVCLMFVGGYLQAEYTENGFISHAQFQKYKGYMDGTFIFRLICRVMTIAGLFTLIVGSFLYVGYKLDADDRDWNYMSIPLVITIFMMLLASLISGMIFCAYSKATGIAHEKM